MFPFNGKRFGKASLKDTTTSKILCDNEEPTISKLAVGILLLFLADSFLYNPKWLSARFDPTIIMLVLKSFFIQDFWIPKSAVFFIVIVYIYLTRKEFVASRIIHDPIFSWVYFAFWFLYDTFVLMINECRRLLHHR